MSCSTPNRYTCWGGSECAWAIFYSNTNSCQTKVGLQRQTDVYVQHSNTTTCTCLRCPPLELAACLRFRPKHTNSCPQSPLELPQLRSCVSLKHLMLLVLLLVTAFVCSVAFAILQGALLASLCAWLKKHCAAHTNRVAAGLHASSSVCGRVFQPTECASVGVRECQAAKLCCSSTCQLCS